MASKLTAHKSAVREELLADHRRKGVTFDGYVSVCEGGEFERHVCYGPTEMNEVIYSKQKFRGVKKKQPFYHVFNCSLTCQWAHQSFGHSRAFRNWFMTRVASIYGAETVYEWALSLPLKSNEELIFLEGLCG